MKAKKRPNGATPVDDLATAQAAFDQASEDYIDAVNGGDPATIATARRALQIAIANYITAMANAE